jgi:RNA polymerase sigma-70 factor, ECF subfamily
VDNPEPSDEALCARVAAGDERAFDQLVERYQARAYRTAWLILRDADEARDLSQEAFVRLYQAAGRFRGEARFSTWFHRILVNLCLDHRRKWRFWRDRGTAADEIEQVPAPEASPVDAIGREQATRALWDAVARLSPKQRAALVLLVQEGLETREIAAVLKMSEATVRVHLHRAVAALRKRIGPDGGAR